MPKSVSAYFGKGGPCVGQTALNAGGAVMLGEEMADAKRRLVN